MVMERLTRWAMVAVAVGVGACSGGDEPPTQAQATPAPQTTPVEPGALVDGPSSLAAGPPRGLMPDVRALAVGRHLGSVTTTAWSADGKLVATGSWDGTTRLWEAGTGRQVHLLLGPTEDIEGLAFSPDGRMLAAVSRNSNGAVWNVATGEFAYGLAHHTDSVESVVWSPDGGKLATGSWDGTIRVWESMGGAQKLVIEAHEEGIFALEWSPDGTRLASGSQDRAAAVWDATTGAKIADLQPHSDAVYSVAWHPDGTRVATGSRDGTVVLHDAATAQKLQHWSVGEHVLVVAFSADGDHLVAAGWDGRGLLLDPDSGETSPAPDRWQLQPAQGALRLALPAE